MREFEYRGHRVEITELRDDDVSKLWHDVHCPDGEVRFCDVSPYGDTTAEIMKWIDLGYPDRIGTGPLTMSDLYKIEQERIKVVVMSDGETWDVLDNCEIQYLTKTQLFKKMNG